MKEDENRDLAGNKAIEVWILHLARAYPRNMECFEAVHETWYIFSMEIPIIIDGWIITNFTNSEHKREPVENQSSFFRCNQKWIYSLCQLSETKLCYVGIKFVAWVSEVCDLWVYLFVKLVIPNYQFATWPGQVLKEKQQETWGKNDFWNLTPRLV